jgi:hypothetical protein
MVMMCASGVWGMDDEMINDMYRSACNRLMKFEPISLGFGGFLGSARTKSMDQWHKEMLNISQNISDILADKSDRDIEYVGGAIYGVSSYNFDDFCKFCSHFSENSSLRSLTISFLALIPRLLLSLPDLVKQWDMEDRIPIDIGQCTQTASEFSLFLESIPDIPEPLVTISSVKLFERVADCIKPALLP